MIETKRKPPTTKRLIIPAASILQCMLNDNEIHYPIEISYTDETSGVYRLIKSRDMLKDLIDSKGFDVGALILIRFKDYNTTLELKNLNDNRCGYEVPIPFSDFHNLALLRPNEVKNIYPELKKLVTA